MKKEKKEVKKLECGQFVYILYHDFNREHNDKTLANLGIVKHVFREFEDRCEYTVSDLDKDCDFLVLYPGGDDHMSMLTPEEYIEYLEGVKEENFETAKALMNNNSRIDRVIDNIKERIPSYEKAKADYVLRKVRVDTQNHA